LHRFGASGETDRSASRISAVRTDPMQGPPLIPLLPAVTVMSEWLF
jgi:hypothetical protein